MKIYAVSFFKYNDKETNYHYFDSLEKAQKKIEEIAKRYKPSLIVWNKCESGLWSFKIALDIFYMDNSFKDKFDRWFIDEIEVQ